MNKGLTFVELLVTITILAIVMLGLSEYTLNTMKVADKQSAQLGKAEQTRTTASKIRNDLKRAAYIYPSNHQISLNIIDISYPGDPKRTSLSRTRAYTNEYISINTNDALAMLIPTNEIDSSSVTQSTIINTYFIKVYFLDDDKLWEFSTDSPVYWQKNTIPASLFNSLSGSANVIADNVIEDSSNLVYYMAKGYSDQYDTVLSTATTSVSANDAMIGGAKWELELESLTGNDSYTLEVKGISRNVPRYTQ